MADGQHFRAFISYAHVDARFAARLQRRLENYRLPKRLADRAGASAGQLTNRVGPIFRDREDFSAAGDLSQAVRGALAQSDALVVVASPAAAKSHWVAQEIALFRAIHPDRAILVALVAGEPASAFPELLTASGVEPLAADFRPQGDGWRLAFLKLVAALCALPLDSLVQRDAQRQLRRVMAVTLSAVLVLAILAAALVMVWRSEVKADHLRAEAESIVTFMQSDLRDPLRGTGNIKVMTAVSQRALDYFNAQGDPRHLSDQSRLLRALVLIALGEDQANDGDIDAAAARFDDAYRSSAEVLARRPRDPDAIFAHAQSAFWKGYVGWEKNDRAVATSFWQDYVRLAKTLSEVERGSVRGLMEQGYAAGNLCELAHKDRFDEPAAARYCAEAIDFETRARTRQIAAIRQVPASRVSAERARLRQIEEALANRHGWMASVHMALKDPAAAIVSRDREAALLDGLLADDPTNVEHVLRRTWSDLGRAEARLQLGEPEEVAAMLRAGLDRHELLLMRSGGGQRVNEALMREYLLLARGLMAADRSFAAELSRAQHFKALMSASGDLAARRANAIWNRLWDANDGG